MHDDDQRAAIVSRLLALKPNEFVDEADRLLSEISDEERGILASALIDAYPDDASENATIISQLRLDSADPSLMSRRDVSTLLTHLQAHDRQALRRALLLPSDASRLHSTLGGLFAPSRGTSDTSSLGSDPTTEMRPHDRLSPR
jgi:hypothetical protein